MKIIHTLCYVLEKSLEIVEDALERKQGARIKKQDNNKQLEKLKRKLQIS